jgi:hypothetical protein
MAVRERIAATAFSILAALPACASPFGSREPVVDVLLREEPAKDLWHVNYHLPDKAAGVEFVHVRGAYRNTAWGILPADARWVEAPTGERLCFSAPRRDFAATFAGDSRRREKDYELTVALSDGGRLLYTGQLVVRPLATCATDPSAPADAAKAEATPPRHRFRLATDPDRVVRVGGDLGAAGSIEWRPPAGREETYAYFGHGSASPGARVAMVVDPTLPAWMSQDLEETLVKVADRFAGETSMSLPARPFVVVAFDPHGSGRSFDGGTLGDMVQLTATGEGWLTATPEARVEWLVRLSHELFHLWGGGLLNADAESEWLSEALAESFALRAAYGLGVLDAPQVAQRLVDLGNRCLVTVGGQPLLTAGERHAWDAFYTCGPVVLFVAGQAVERAHPGEGGLGLLVRKMFAEGHDAGRVYGTGTFLGWLDKLSGDRETVFALQGFVRRGVPRGADRFLAQQFVDAGYRVALAAPSEAHASPEVVDAMLRAGLVRCACGGAADPSGAAAAAEGDCARLSGSARIARVGEVEVRRDPAAAYGRLRAAAGLTRPLRVVVGDEKEPLTLFCGKDTLDSSFDQLLVLQ